MICELTLQYGKEDPLLLQLFLNIIIPKSREDMCTVSIVVRIGGCSVRDPAWCVNGKKAMLLFGDVVIAWR